MHPSRPPRVLGPVDWLVALLLLAGATLALPALRAAGPTLVLVYRDNALLARYPLSDSTEFTVEGAQGNVRVRIADGAVRVTESSCPRGICVATGAVSTPGRQIVCAPNHVLVQLVSGSRDTPDAVTE